MEDAGSRGFISQQPRKPSAVHEFLEAVGSTFLP